jgi:midasin
MEATVEESGEVLVARRRHSLEAVAGFDYLDLKDGAKIIESMREGLSRLHFLTECTDVCVMVEGPIGCGKTTMVLTYAESQGYHYGDNLVIIHLGEQIDSKMLLGTYASTSNPGEFTWLPGILTKAVTHGKWVILEDIDRAPSDVVSTLLPLVKDRELVIPGYSQLLQAASHFKLFLTQRNAEKRNPISVYSSVLQQHCALLQLSTFTQDEIKQVVVKQYPHLQSVCERLLSTCSSSLTLHLRHILKFCKRISTYVHDGHVSSMEDLLLELIDCFGGYLSSENRICLSMEFRPICGGIAKEKVEQLCMKRKPLLQITPTTLTVGRAYLHYTTTKELPRVYYAHTRSSLALLESVCRCVQMNEPVLLVGETGVGKTATLDYLSKISGNKLVVVNMSQQTESSDLLGGFKPMQVTQFLGPVREEFEQLFHSTFSMKQNAQFLSSLQVCYAQKQWKKWFRLILHSQESALKRVKGEKGNGKASLYAQWTALGMKLRKLRKQLQKPQAALAFAFVEGTLVEAVQRGWWVLLDEINLASPETLQCLSSLLEDSQGSFVVTERGDSKPVVRDPNFRLFCCMNPATDVGKKQLPFIIRNRFTEFFVEEPQSTSDLALLVMSYLRSTSPSAALVDGIISLYRAIKELAERRLQDGTGKKPNYSLRSLCRALLYAASNQCGTFLRSLYEGFCMAFLTELRQDHHQLVIALIKQYLNTSESCISASIPQPKEPGFINVEGFWLMVGSESAEVSPDYVLTESVQENLRNLARVVSARCHPVLLQGPTSSGKTSLVQYLAKLTGHKCLRINNHEHTDLQEYVGMYTANSQGQLVFQEGVLVNAMRKGYWIILDELNLAPTDVLEAINRVLDDNRELFIPETQQVVKAHSNFLLFGTQNPPGHYGGRKVLSRAFRNRFIELHYDDIPNTELVTILEKRSKLPQSYAKRMVAVLRDLQQRRSSSGIFAGKYGLITLRDLFRWAERYRWSQSVDIFSDWEQQIAEDGYMLLGGRQRNSAEEAVILEVISKHFKRTVTPSRLFGYDGGVGSLASKQTLEVIKVPLPSEFCHLVWTPELLRMAVLVHRATQFKEPVLLVGNTGCGKTTICQILASIMGQKFYSINCHMHTEAADFLGGLRPVRNRSAVEVSCETAMFEWVDGIVLEAMKEGGCLLIDEISLAEDAVLERLNSLLEPERKLLVSERSRPEDDVYELTAKEEFVFMATMNPGGDFGKKELSPALRNRFVEIWCPAISARESFDLIILHNLKPDLKHPNSGGILWSNLMLDVMDWLQKLVFSTKTVFSIRDLLTWVKFMNITAPPLTPAEAFFHGAHMVFLDAMGCGDRSVAEHRQDITAFIHAQLKRHGVNLILKEDLCQEMNCTDDQLFGIHPFYIEKGVLGGTNLNSYSLKAPGPHINAYRLLRSMQLSKPLLLEGAPGVGKTSLVIALAKASGHFISRINLSEHTDINDLFGADLPVEGGKGVNFAWRDGPLLRALKNGDWVLLDEMNLASQSVLEGLNACLDHRGEIYIPELGMTFKVQPGTRLFACQNPLRQGGGRKGLPKSFVNRFTQVYIDALTASDLLFITSSLYPSFDPDLLKKMIAFNSKVASLTADSGSSLWEFNLRDVLRWCELLQTHQTSGPSKPELFMSLVYLSRLRSKEMRRKVQVIFLDVFECSEDGLYHPPMPLGLYFHVSKEEVQVSAFILQ